MSDLFDSRFIINTGKGGVGKTTVSAAMAVAFAARGKRVLLMQLNVTDRMGRLFGVDPIGTEIEQIVPGIFGVNTTPEDSLREYALMILRVKALYRAVFENRVVSKLLKVMPGLPELTMLGKAYYHEGEKENGAPVWDVVIIDAPATGHGMFLLQIPQVISSALHSGKMADESAAMLALLEDHERTAVNLITLPEEMPVNETIELRRQLREEFDIRVGAIIANAVVPRILEPHDVTALTALLEAHDTPNDHVGTLMGAALHREHRCDLQDTYLARLREELDHPVVEIPYYFEPEFDRAVLEKIARHLSSTVGGVE